MDINPELAEIAGIHAGDGYMRYIGKRKEFDVSGNYEEKDYYNNHVIPLFNRFFGLKIKGRFFPSRRTYGFRITHPKVLKQLSGLGFPSGTKSLTVRIPKIISSSRKKEIFCSFLRGYFDTDGCLTFMNRKNSQNYPDFKRRYNYYPRIILKSVSQGLINDISKLLNKLKFRSYICKKVYKNNNWNDSYELYSTGEGNLTKWMSLVGTKNPVKYSRYLLWKKFGFCPSNTTYNQRINILEGKLNPYMCQRHFKSP